MKKVSFINMLKIGIFDTRRYKELLNVSLRKALTYCLIVSIMIGAIVGVKQLEAANTIIERVNSELSKDDMSFEMKDYNLNLKNSPKSFEDSKLILLIDTTKSLSEEDKVRSKVIHKDISMTLFKDGMAYRNGETHYTVKYKDGNIIDKDFNNKDVLNLINESSSYKYIIFIISTIGILLLYLFNSLILAIFSNLLNRIMNTQLSFKTRFILSIVASTVPTIISTIYPSTLIALVLGLICLSSGMRAIKKA